MVQMQVSWKTSLEMQDSTVQVQEKFRIAGQLQITPEIQDGCRPCIQMCATGGVNGLLIVLAQARMSLGVSAQ
jgi:hypothetical protein